MEQRAMICWGVVVLVAASAFLGGCAPAPEQGEAEIQETPEPTLDPGTGSEIETADFVITITGQAGKYFVNPNYESDQTNWEMNVGVLIQFVNGTDMPVTVTASPADYFGIENSTFSIEKDHSDIKNIVGLPADDTELKLSFSVGGEDGTPPSVVTGGPKMVVTGSATSAPD